MAKAAEGADRCGAQSPKVIELGSMNLIGEGGAKVWGKTRMVRAHSGCVQARCESLPALLGKSGIETRLIVGGGEGKESHVAPGVPLWTAPFWKKE